MVIVKITFEIRPASNVLSSSVMVSKVDNVVKYNASKLASLYYPRRLYYCLL
jgi:hypothetical protein